MKRIVSAAILAAAVFAASAPAMAGSNDFIETYCARLGEDDHFNSNGQRLDNVAAIIRQDRANYHAFGIRDRGDQNDRTFASKANRARLEAMLNNGKASRAVRNEIVNGTPTICVDVYENFIDVTLQ